MSDKWITTCCGERMTYEWGCKRCKKCGAEIVTTPLQCLLSGNTNTTEPSNEQED